MKACGDSGAIAAMLHTVVATFKGVVHKLKRDPVMTEIGAGQNQDQGKTVYIYRQLICMAKIGELTFPYASFKF